jgi:hypothetical protein
MTLMVRRATRGGTGGLLAQTLSMPVAEPDAAGATEQPGRSVTLAWNAVATTRLGDAFEHLSDAVRQLERTPDPELTGPVIDIAQRIGGTITILRGHVEDALAVQD